MERYFLKDFDYELPPELISQQAKERTKSKIIIPDNNMEVIEFSKIINFFSENDILVINTSKVMRARFFGICKRTGKQHEVIFVEDLGKNKWNAMIFNIKKLKLNDEIVLNNNSSFILNEKKGYLNEVIFHGNCLYDLMEREGIVPLPPYIKRENGKNNNKDILLYQTCYARDIGSAAAPTAGMHFDDNLINVLKRLSVEIIPLKLHVGLGTFLPVKSDIIEKHKMHGEICELSELSAEKLNEGIKKGKRITAVGTTSLRVLESCFINNEFKPYYGKTDIFIYPPKKIKSADRLITNFHQPKSTLFMMVSSFCGLNYMKNVYKNAVNNKMSFLSFGDAMLLNNKYKYV